MDCNRISAEWGVIGGVVSERLNTYESEHDFTAVSEIFAMAQKLRTCLETAVSHVKTQGDATFHEYHARRLVDISTDAVLSYLLCIDALASERKQKIAQIFIGRANRTNTINGSVSVSRYA